MKYINKDRLINRFLELARIPSPSGQEPEICQYLAHSLVDLGLQIVGDDYGNIIAKLAGTGKPIILCAHMDTVAIGEGTMIVPIVKEDVITSDGTTILGADNKDSIAAILEALSIVRENRLENRAAEIVFTKEEEAISRGAMKLDITKLRGKECLISDCPEPYGTITTNAPFWYGFDVKVSGVRCHAKEPEKGVNVAAIMAKAISSMPLGRIDALTTSNIAYQILGLKGIVDNPKEKVTNIPKKDRNSIPDLGIISGEVRGLKIEKVIESLARIEALFTEVASEFGGRSSFEQKKLADGYYFSEEDPLVKFAASIFSDQGVAPRYIPSIGGSDANILNGRGINTIVISSAHRENHKVSEYLIIDDLIKLADFYVRCLTNLPQVG